MRWKNPCAVAYLVAAIIWPSQLYAQSEGDAQYLRRLIYLAQHENRMSVRLEYLREITDRISNDSSIDIDQEVVAQISGLLDDEADGVRGYAAQALGRAGSRALSAVQALKAAYLKAKRQECALLVITWISSSDYMASAIKNISGETVPSSSCPAMQKPNCELEIKFTWRTSPSQVWQVSDIDRNLLPWNSNLTEKIGGFSFIQPYDKVDPSDNVDVANFIFNATCEVAIKEINNALISWKPGGNEVPKFELIKAVSQY